MRNVLVPVMQTPHDDEVKGECVSKCEYECACDRVSVGKNEHVVVVCGEGCGGVGMSEGR